MLTRLVFAGAIVLLIQGTAAAQYNNGGLDTSGAGSDHLSVPIVPHQASSPTAEQSWRQKELDKDYEATTRAIPNKKISTDPWGDLRSTKNK
jgi:hypothetical protein